MGPEMKRRYFVTLLLLCCALYGKSMAQPKLEIVEGTTLDFGSVNKGEIITKDITLKNTGTETLLIGQVQASCGCTGTLVSSDHIAPGKTGSLQITFNSKNFSGPVHKSITINSNAGSDAKTVLQFAVTVIEEVKVLSGYFMFRDAMVGRASTYSIKVRNEGAEAFEITGSKTQLGGFSIKLPTKPIMPGESVDIVATLTPKAVTTLSDGVFLTTTNAHQPEVYVRILGNVKEFKFE